MFGDGEGRRTRSIVGVAIVLAISASVPWLGGCGPERTSVEETWMLGTFSNRAPGLTSQDSALTHYEVHADFRFLIVDVTGCGENIATVREEHRWESTADDVIEVDVQDEESVLDAYRVRRGPSCDRVSFEQVFGPEISGPDNFPRGAVCMRDLPPCGPDEVECDSCETIWCDEPWPECDDD